MFQNKEEIIKFSENKHRILVIHYQAHDRMSFRLRLHDPSSEVCTLKNESQVHYFIVQEPEWFPYTYVIEKNQKNDILKWVENSGCSKNYIKQNYSFISKVLLEKNHYNFL